MRRWIPAVAVGTLLVGLIVADEPKKDGPLAAEFAKFKKEVAERTAEANKARPNDRAELLSELKEYQVIEMDKLFDLAEQEPESATAFDVFSELQTVALDKEKQKKARDLLLKHHLEQPHIKKAIPSLAKGTDPKAEDLLKVIADKNRDKDCQGQATLVLGMLAKAKAKQSGGEAKAELMKKAEAYLAAARDKFADVKYEASTVGKLAAGELAGLKLIGNLEVGKAVPEIAGEGIDGKAFKLSDHKGKVVMLSFWATWCPPCMALVPHEIELVEKMKDKPFALIGVNGDDLTDDVMKVIADKKITWPSFKDKQADLPPLSNMWDIAGWPTIYVIDHKGVIRHKWTGSPGAAKMDEAIEKLVADAEKDGKK